MNLTGGQFIGRERSKDGNEKFFAVNPVTGENLSGEFMDATPDEIHQVIAKSEKAFETYRQVNPLKRAEFLDAAAGAILELGHTLIERCMEETGLPQVRLEGERGRTVGQLRMFAQYVREGSWVDARIDTALPERTPIPRSDIRQMLQPLGPVAIFGASNFPLAFSVAGGDTASALASGCPVVIKAHPSHPGTSELVLQALLQAVEETGMPDGIVSLVQGRRNEVGKAMVEHPLIQAVGFTGSFQGGKALFDLANQRPVPIPVFAEMSSVNPVFLLPGALKERGEKIAEGLAASVTLGVGQFCTNPGMVVQTTDSVDFENKLRESIQNHPGGTMLSGSIRKAYHQGLERIESMGVAGIMAKGQILGTNTGVGAAVYFTTPAEVESHPVLREEVFGPSTMIVKSESGKEVLEIARKLEGHLTATIHGTPEDLEEYRELITILERKVGRLIINGFPTGVEVCHSMVHGGPYPATTQPHSTSVGTNAIRRFCRPVCYQDFPDQLLPVALQNGNPLKIWRLINGEWSMSGW